MWVAKARALLNVWLGWIAAILNLDGAYDGKFWMQRFGGRFLLTGRHRAAQCENNDYEPVASDSCPVFFMSAAAGEKASVLRCPASQLYIFTPQRRSAHWQRCVR